MKSKRIKDPIYNCDITLVYDCSQEDFYQFIKKKHSLELIRQYAYAEHIKISNDKTGVRHYLWTIRSKDISFFGLIVHEVFHIARDCFNEIGMGINEETNEAFAYYQEYIFTQVLRIYLIEEKGKK